MKKLKTLIVDDHPSICLGYKMFLDNWCEKEGLVQVTCKITHTLKDGLDTFLKSPKSFDLVILDIRMPCCAEEKLFSGEDLGLRIKTVRPEIKIIVLTSLVDNHHLYSIFRLLDPDGILIKSDFDDRIFISAVKAVLANKTYYTSSFDNLLRKQFSTDFLMDKENREILYLLSIGVRVKDLPEKIHLTLSAIEKRLRFIKKQFHLEHPNVIELVHTAKEKGFL